MFRTSGFASAREPYPALPGPDHGPDGKWRPQFLNTPVHDGGHRAARGRRQCTPTGPSAGADGRAGPRPSGTAGGEATIRGVRRLVEQRDGSPEIRRWLAELEQEEERWEGVLRGLETEAARPELRVHPGKVRLSHDRSPLLGLAGQGLGRVEAASPDRDPRHRPPMAAAPLPRALDHALRPASGWPSADQRRDRRPRQKNGRDESLVGRPPNPWRTHEARHRGGRADRLPADPQATLTALPDVARVPH